MDVCPIISPNAPTEHPTAAPFFEQTLRMTQELVRVAE